eukprot:TRINITY_DN29401_c0_g1_i1.p1 TRINITY_DN29401_c0_g1~~TRINITY_DN29401_c0_g1_i1.p1  ORF type:complete len:254 (-),score=44.05 TRINITY_DN29401_c0_g1_i1:663-1424(-)
MMVLDDGIHSFGDCPPTVLLADPLAENRHARSKKMRGYPAWLQTSLQTELSGQYRSRIVADARQACKDIDRAILCALRQLPKSVRCKPARQVVLEPRVGRSDSSSSSSGQENHPKVLARSESKQSSRDDAASAAAPSEKAGSGSASPAHVSCSPHWEILDDKCGLLAADEDFQQTERTSSVSGGASSADGASDVYSHARLLDLGDMSKFMSEFGELLKVSEARLDSMPDDKRRRFMDRMMRVSQVMLPSQSSR